MNLRKKLGLVLISTLALAGCFNNEEKAPVVEPETRPVEQLNHKVEVVLDENEIIDHYVNQDSEQLKEFNDYVDLRVVSKDKDILQKGKIQLTYILENKSQEIIKRVSFDAVVSIALNEQKEVSNNFYLVIPVHFNHSANLTDITPFKFNKETGMFEVLAYEQGSHYLLPGEKIELKVDYALQDFTNKLGIPEFIRELDPKELGFRGVLTIANELVTLKGKVIKPQLEIVAPESSDDANQTTDGENSETDDSTNETDQEPTSTPNENPSIEPIEQPTK